MKLVTSLIGRNLVFIVLFGCASYQTQVQVARSKMVQGDPLAAATLLEQKAAQEGKDQVLFLLDYALALHQAKEYKKSIDAFLKADKLAEVKDYVSLSRQAGSLLTSERLVQYKSERFENIIINAYLALNFLLKGEYDEALVECRRIDEKLNRLRLEGESSHRNFFARYLSAVIWEAQGNWDSAYIDYKNAYDIDPTMPYLREDLIRAAWQARRFQTLKKWQKRWPKVKLPEQKTNSKERGELVFIFQQGWVPRKTPHPEDYRFPTMERVYSGIRRAEMEVNGDWVVPTSMLYDVAGDAIYTMREMFKVLVAKKMAGLVAKAVVADQIRQKNEALGNLAYIAMRLSDQADLRQWSTLPESFQISRLYLPPGHHKVKLTGLGVNGETLMWEGEVEIKRGKKTFLTRRSF